MIKGAGRIVINPLHDMKRVLVPSSRPDLPGFLLINKCGTTTMSQALRGVLPMESHYKHEEFDREIVTMWREPYSRIESTFRMYSEKPEAHPRFTEVYGFERTPSFADWLATSLEKYRAGEQHDPHQLPMYDVATDKNERFVPTKIIRWDWVELARTFELPVIKQLNASKKEIETAWTDGLRIKYRRLFREDFRVWESGEPC